MSQYINVWSILTPDPSQGRDHVKYGSPRYTFFSSDWLCLHLQHSTSSVDMAQRNLEFCFYLSIIMNAGAEVSRRFHGERPFKAERSC